MLRHVWGLGWGGVKKWCPDTLRLKDAETGQVNQEIVDGLFCLTHGGKMSVRVSRSRTKLGQIALARLAMAENSCFFLPRFQHALRWTCCQCLIVYRTYVFFNRKNTQNLIQKITKTSTENVEPNKFVFVKSNVNALINVFERRRVSRLPCFSPAQRAHRGSGRVALCRHPEVREGLHPGTALQETWQAPPPFPMFGRRMFGLLVYWF